MMATGDRVPPFWWKCKHILHYPHNRFRSPLPASFSASTRLAPTIQRVSLLKRGIDMAKPIGPKTLLIRDAIKANPGMGNKELAAKLMDSNDRMDDKIKVTPQDVAQQKQELKKAGVSVPVASAAAKTGRPKGSKTKKVSATPKPVSARSPSASPFDLIDRVFDLASDCGGFAQLKRLVERLGGGTIVDNG
jgi:hypothetical protein